MPGLPLPPNLQRIYDNARIRLAANNPDIQPQPDYLDPRLLEGLRIEMQRRLRAATGEEHAIVRFEFPGTSHL